MESNERFLAHLDSVAASLKRDGLYFIQNMGLDWTKDLRQNWTMERGGITVKASFEYRIKDVLNQVGVEKMNLEVNDRGRKKRFVKKSI